MAGQVTGPARRSGAAGVAVAGAARQRRLDHRKESSPHGPPRRSSRGVARAAPWPRASPGHTQCARPSRFSTTAAGHGEQPPFADDRSTEDSAATAWLADTLLDQRGGPVFHAKATEPAHRKIGVETGTATAA